MSIPVDKYIDQPYPLKCWNSVGDGFSGWYAVTSNEKCKDFCFWEVTSTDENEENETLPVYNSENTADPHETTTLSNSHWTCALNSANDETKWDTVENKLTPPGGFGDTFDYLRCNRGPNEVLENAGSTVSQSLAFWSFAFIFAVLGVIMEVWFVWRRRRRRQRECQNEKKSSVAEPPTALTAKTDEEVGSSDEPTALVAKVDDEEEVAPKDGSAVDIADEEEVALLKDPSAVDVADVPAEEKKEEGNGEGGVSVDAEGSKEIVGPSAEGADGGASPPEADIVPIDGSHTQEEKDRDDQGKTELSAPATKAEEEGAPPPGPSAVESAVTTDMDVKEKGNDSEGGSVDVKDSQEKDADDKELNKEIECDTDDEEARCTTTMRRLRNRICNKRVCWCLFLFLFNALLIGVLLISLLSLIDLSGNELPTTASKLTPVCSNPDDVCSKANRNIDRNPDPYSDPMRPFSYIVASDSQLDWYSGEAPNLGKSNVPIPCTESDTCKECKAKVGPYTNQQMKKTMEKLISSSDDGSGVKPTSLVMNGDLTAYFHPDEFDRYKDYFHNVNGLEHFWPGLGNHDYDHYDGARYSGDQWLGPAACNAAHGIGYIKSGFCNKIPKFHPDRVVRYDASSLAYSWNEGSYHFVHLHYYPSFESRKLGIRSSMMWLEQDLALAKAENRNSVIFVHAASGLNAVTKKILLDADVKAVFSGHFHRCIMQRCVGLRALKEWEVVDPNVSQEVLPESEKCIPATMALCSLRASSGGGSLYYLKDADPDLKRPMGTLSNATTVRKGRELCKPPQPTYVNTTDNTLLCKGYMRYEPFINETDDTSSGGKNKPIPVFWSGSSSFETMLKVDFYQDKFTVRLITAEAGMEGSRYVDTHDVPNAVYPHHERTDMEDITITL